MPTNPIQVLCLLKALKFVLVARTRKPPFQNHTFFKATTESERTLLKEPQHSYLLPPNKAHLEKKKAFMGFMDIVTYIGTNLLGGATYTFPAAQSPPTKCLGINLTKEVKHLFTESKNNLYIQWNTKLNPNILLHRYRKKFTNFMWNHKVSQIVKTTLYQRTIPE